MKKYFIKAPYFIKFFIINLYAFVLCRKRYNNNFYQNLKYYIENDKSEVFSFNLEKFQKQIHDNKFFNNDFKHIEEYRVINKQFIKDNYNEQPYEIYCEYAGFELENGADSTAIETINYFTKYFPKSFFELAGGLK